MKKLLSLILTLALTLCALPALAQPTNEGDFTYSLRDDYAIIEAYTGTDAEVEIPEMLGNFPVKEVAANSFYETGIRSIQFPSTLRSIDQNAFCCSALESVSLPEGFTELAPYAFAASPALKDVTLPEGMIIVSNMVFGECSSLACVNLPSTIRRIETAAFISCAALTNITLPEGLIEIEDTVFYDCAALKTLTLPVSVKAIGRDAFYGCPDITLRVYAGSYAETYAKENSIPFEYIAENTAVIPDELVGAWKGEGKPIGGGSAIELTFTINADGTGSYTFEQAGYVESQQITVNPGDGSFAVETLQDSQIGLTACEGTFIHEDGTLTLSITSTLSSGREFRYEAVCRKDQPNAFSLPNDLNWDSSIADVMTALGMNANVQTNGDLTFVAIDDALFADQETEMGYVFSGGELRLVECMLYDSIVLPDVIATLTRTHGTPNMTDLNRLIELIEDIGGSIGDRASLEASPWAGWMLTDERTLVFTTLFDGIVGVIYANDGVSDATD